LPSKPEIFTSPYSTSPSSLEFLYEAQIFPSLATNPSSQTILVPDLYYFRHFCDCGSCRIHYICQLNSSDSVEFPWYLDCNYNNYRYLRMQKKKKTNIQMSQRSHQISSSCFESSQVYLYIQESQPNCAICY